MGTMPTENKVLKPIFIYFVDISISWESLIYPILENMTFFHYQVNKGFFISGDFIECS